jgi:hypothetical protein
VWEKRSFEGVARYSLGENGGKFASAPQLTFYFLELVEIRTMIGLISHGYTKLHGLLNEAR